MYHIVKAWKAKTSDDFFLSYDNAKIQETADISELYHPHYPGDNEYVILVDPEASRLKLPPYSHDLNRPIEHIFGTMKHKIREQLYFEHMKYTTALSVQNMVWDQFHKHMPKQQVEKDVRGLPYLWDVLSTPFGIQVQREDDSIFVGSGGNWPTQEYR